MAKNHSSEATLDYGESRSFIAKALEYDRVVKQNKSTEGILLSIIADL